MLYLSTVVMAGAAGITALSLIAGRIALSARLYALPLAMLPFALIAFISWLRSPFGVASVKPAVQIVGIIITLLVMVGLTAACRGRPRRYFRAARLLLATLALLGAVATAQFVINNVLRAFVVDFAFLNVLSGEIAIGGGSIIGGLWRAHAMTSEPSHLGLYVSVGAGPALMRLGFLGRGRAAAIAPLIRKRTAFSILAGIFVTLSSLGIGAVAATAAAIWLFDPRVRFWRAIAYVGVFLALLFGGVLALLQADSEIVEKAMSLALVAQAAQGQSIGGIDAGDVTALAIATNFYVMQMNLERWPLLGAGIGAHPVAFAATPLLPFAEVPDQLIRLNSQDAASLAIRLLSETGLLGMAAFLLFILGATVALRKAIERQWDFARYDGRYATAAVMCMGLAASAVGVVAAGLVRFAFYYGGPVWTAMVLVAPITAIYASRSGSPR